MRRRRSAGSGGAREASRDRSTPAWLGAGGGAVVPLALALAAAGAGVFQAIQLTWTSDDAYISFRYADNLVRGMGLVFNAGERVEGYSNFLWTVWCALGLKLGFGAEAWANASSVTCYALTILTLGLFSWRRMAGRPGWPLPLAAILTAFHRDCAVFATSGLETALMTLLVTAGYVLLALAPASLGALAGAGAIYGLAALTRPDGILFGVLGVAYVLWVGRPRLAAIASYGIPLALIVVPFALWKLHYYGDVRPNTYYAKSADLAWYSQGLVYLGLYLAKYWVLGLGPVLVGLAAWLDRRRATGAATRVDAPPAEAPSPWVRSAALAAVQAAAYTFYVVRVGGDFMFARLLIPVAPLLMVLVELGLDRLLFHRGLDYAVAGLLAVLGLAATPYPFSGQGWVSGIVNEHEVYTPEVEERFRSLGLSLRRYFDGLPVRVAFPGATAVVAYYSRAPVAIEVETGLTDSTIAHQKLTRRGRVGHEKHASYEYLLDQRRVHFFLSAGRVYRDSLQSYATIGKVVFDGNPLVVSHWDSKLMSEIRRRGARIDDFERVLDGYIRDLPLMSDSAVRADYPRIRRFYFNDAGDSAREAPFLRRLAVMRP